MVREADQSWYLYPLTERIIMIVSILNVHRGEVVVSDPVIGQTDGKTQR